MNLLDFNVGDKVQFVDAPAKWNRDRIYTITYLDINEISVMYDGHAYTFSAKEVEEIGMMQFDVWSETP